MKADTFNSQVPQIEALYGFKKILCARIYFLVNCNCFKNRLSLGPRPGERTSNWSLSWVFRIPDETNGAGKSKSGMLPLILSCPNCSHVPYLSSL